MIAHYFATDIISEHYNVISIIDEPLKRSGSTSHPKEELESSRCFTMTQYWMEVHYHQLGKVCMQTDLECQLSATFILACTRGSNAMIPGIMLGSADCGVDVPHTLEL